MLKKIGVIALLLVLFPATVFAAVNSGESNVIGKGVVHTGLKTIPVSEPGWVYIEAIPSSGVNGMRLIKYTEDTNNPKVVETKDFAVSEKNKRLDILCQGQYKVEFYIGGREMGSSRIYVIGKEAVCDKDEPYYKFGGPEKPIPKDPPGGGDGGGDDGNGGNDGGGSDGDGSGNDGSDGNGSGDDGSNGSGGNDGGSNGGGDGSGNGDGSGGSGGDCDSCGILDCPGWSDYMDKLDDIKKAIPAAPNWDKVADKFRDSIAPKIKKDLQDVLGRAPTPPAAPAKPSKPSKPNKLDDNGLKAPEGKEIPKGGEFDQDKIKSEAPKIKEREDPTGGFEINNPIDALPSQDEFKDNVPDEGEAELPEDPEELENKAPTPPEKDNEAPTPDEKENSAPEPDEEANKAPSPSEGENEAPTPTEKPSPAPKPDEGNNKAPVPDDSGGSAPVPGGGEWEGGWPMPGTDGGGSAPIPDGSSGGAPIPKESGNPPLPK